MTFLYWNYMSFKIFVIFLYCLMETHSWCNSIVVFVLPMQGDSPSYLHEGKVNVFNMKDELSFNIICHIFSLLAFGLLWVFSESCCILKRSSVSLTSSRNKDYFELLCVDINLNFAHKALYYRHSPFLM